MKYSEVIELVDKRTPNEYDAQDKMRWLLSLDQMIYDEIVATHENEAGITRPAAFTEDDALLVPEPYAEDIYVNFLQSKIAKENEETAKYNIAITLYNDAYANYDRHYNSKHRPTDIKKNYFQF